MGLLRYRRQGTIESVIPRKEESEFREEMWVEKKVCCFLILGKETASRKIGRGGLGRAGEDWEIKKCLNTAKPSVRPAGRVK